MDPVTLSLITTAASAGATGLMANAQGKAQAKQAEINAQIAETRAMQTNADSRRGLEGELGSMRAVFGANADNPSVGTLEIMNELRTTRDRERSINYGNRIQEAGDFRMDAKNARYRGRAGMLTGFMSAGPSLFDLYEYRRG